MSIDLDIFRKAGVDDAKDARAQRAIKAFRALQPTLSAYARILTKNPHIRVEMAARDNGSTDGKRIFFRPPIALGDDVLHERRLCDKRDDRKQLLCLACATREAVLTTIYHEIAHICYDSFEKTSDRDRAELISMAVAESGGKYAEAIAAKITNTPDWHKESYIAMASLVSEFLPIIVNALEDARVNRELFKARKGTKVMFDADINRIFTEGVEQKDADGNIIVKKWNEYPPNLQAIVGLFCKASGYDYTGWFTDEVTTALNDVHLAVLVSKIDTVYSAADVYHLSFPVLARLRELGFCKLPEDPQTEESEDDDIPEPTDQSGDSESDDSAGAPSDTPSESADSDAGEPESTDGDSEGGGRGDANSIGTGEEEADAENDSSSGDDQSFTSDDTENTEDSEHDNSGDSQEGEGEGESASNESGSSGSSADNSVDEGSGDDDDSDDSRSAQNDGDLSERGSDLNEDSEGTSEGDSESDVSAAPSSGGEPNSDGSDAAGSSDSDGSSSGATSGSVDSDDHLDPASQDNDLSTGEDSGAQDLDVADSETGEERTGSSGDDMGTAQDVPEEEEAPVSESDSEEPIDSGADDGQGGTEIIENKKNDSRAMGTPAECREALVKWGNHEEKPKLIEEGEAENAVDRAIIQGIYFETPSRNILGVRFHHYGQPIIIDGYSMSAGWDRDRQYALRYGADGNFNPDEKVLGPALLRMRVAFADNQRGKEIRRRKSGKIDARALGKRAPVGDEHIFKKKTLPGKKDYFVVIGMDISGSTVGTNIILEKRAIMAQAQLLSRMGISFAIYGHSGNFSDPTGGRAEGLNLDIYLIKEEGEVWDSKTKERLEKIGPDSANLDGHALEFLRKRLDESTATDKVIMYYSDGRMPAENHDEELEILQRELRLCTRKGYTVMGVGIRTDSPARHGLDTVQVDREEDVVKVVKHLEKRLLAH